ncbi:MAG: hypothetical protein ABJN14_10940 [Paracoccaceae bacterium]
MLGFSEIKTSIDYAIEYFRGRDARLFIKNLDEILKDALEDPKHSMRSFQKLKELAGAFDDDPNGLRRRLIVLRARRFSSSSGEEMWGLQSRNQKEKARSPLDSVSRTSSFVSVIFVTTFVVISVGSVSYFALKYNRKRTADLWTLTKTVIVLGSYKVDECKFAFEALPKKAEFLSDLDFEGIYLVALSNNENYAVTLHLSDPAAMSGAIQEIRKKGIGQTEQTFSELGSAYQRNTEGWAIVASVSECEI